MTPSKKINTAKFNLRTVPQKQRKALAKGPAVSVFVEGTDFVHKIPHPALIAVCPTAQIIESDNSALELHLQQSVSEYAVWRILDWLRTNITSDNAIALASENAGESDVKLCHAARQMGLEQQHYANVLAGCKQAIKCPRGVPSARKFRALPAPDMMALIEKLADSDEEEPLFDTLVERIAKDIDRETHEETADHSQYLAKHPVVSAAVVKRRALNAELEAQRKVEKVQRDETRRRHGAAQKRERKDDQLGGVQQAE